MITRQHILACLAASLLALGLAGKPVAMGPHATPASGFVETLLTGYNVYSEPTLPTLPAAGGELTDPTFGTRILRVTDATTTPNTGGIEGAVVGYSYWPSLNSDNTKAMFLVNSGFTRAAFYSFNAAAFTINTTASFMSAAPAGFQEYGLSWSRVNANLLYGCGNYVLSQYNVSTDTATTVKSFSGRGHTGGYITQASISDDDDVFAGSYETGGTPQGYWVYKRSTTTVLLEVISKANLDEVQIDKSGVYLTVKLTTGDAEVWNVTTGLQVGSTLTGNNAFNHSEMGSGTAVTHRPANTSLGYRSLATPTVIADLLPGLSSPWSYATQQDHFSMRANNNLWMLASRYHSSAGAVSNAFDNEILQVATDGSGRVRRILHHRSKHDDYYDQPKANISMDGQFICFSSNWGTAAGRHDAFIAKIQAAPST